MGSLSQKSIHHVPMIKIYWKRPRSTW